MGFWGAKNSQMNLWLQGSGGIDAPTTQTTLSVFGKPFTGATVTDASCKPGGVPSPDTIWGLCVSGQSDCRWAAGRALVCLLQSVLLAAVRRYACYSAPLRPSLTALTQHCTRHCTAPTQHISNTRDCSAKQPGRVRAPRGAHERPGRTRFLCSHPSPAPYPLLTHNRSAKQLGRQCLAAHMNLAVTAAWSALPGVLPDHACPTADAVSRKGRHSCTRCTLRQRP